MRKVKNKNTIPTALKSIKEFCLSCSGGSAKEVKECIIVRCSLYPYRLGTNPKPGGKKVKIHKALIVNKTEADEASKNKTPSVNKTKSAAANKSKVSETNKSKIPETNKSEAAGVSSSKAPAKEKKKWVSRKLT